MTNAQKFMTAMEDKHLFDHYSVIALRKQNAKLKSEILTLKTIIKNKSEWTEKN